MGCSARHCRGTSWIYLHVVPYDDRETVFFGRPDDWYKFTQDLGTTREYLNLDDTLGMDRVPMLGGGWNSLTQKVKDGKDVRQLLKEAVAKNSKGKPINYLQWLKIKDKIEEAFANWRAQHSEDGKKGLIWSLMQYCHLVETLTTLSGDGATGNIQYWLGSGNPSDNKNLTSRQEGLWPRF
jgi:ribosomal protein L3